LDGTEKLSLLAGIALAEIWGALRSPHELHVWVPILMLVGAIAGCLAICSAPAARSLCLAYFIIVGIADRIVRAPFPGSDVLDATKEAIQVVLTGSNPYVHAFVSTRYPLEPFPYLPGEMLFYGIPFCFHVSLESVEKFAGIGILFLLAAATSIAGAARAAFCTALYAAFSGTAVIAVSGANDVGLAFVSLIAILTLAWSETLAQRGAPPRAVAAWFRTSAVFLAWALAFKALLWPLFPFIVAYLWNKNARTAKSYLITTLGICGCMVAPFLFSAPIGFLTNVYQGFVHGNNGFWGLNIWSALQAAHIPADPHSIGTKITDVGITAATCAALLIRPIASLSGALMRGSATLTIALLLSQYTSGSYWAFAITIFISALAIMPIGENKRWRQSCIYLTIACALAAIT